MAMELVTFSNDEDESEVVSKNNKGQRRLYCPSTGIDAVRTPPLKLLHSNSFQTHPCVHVVTIQPAYRGVICPIANIYLSVYHTYPLLSGEKKLCVDSLFPVYGCHL